MRALLRRLAALPVLFGLVAGTASAQDPPTPDVFHQFVAIGSLLCTEAPSRDCLDHGWQFADANGDGHLDLAELQAVRSGFLDWSGNMQDSLSGKQRTVLHLSRGLARIAPLSSVFSLYDTDGDGRLSKEELTADVQLDERPMAQVLMDREATDWAAIRGRLGRAATLLQLLGAPE
ncbi:EF-hand domain-containing protein [Aquibaculum arenosum]|uniref:EF-hand domain-containing protein n=1 Tax=Aquibaculum arenosum TaxID=3032591 RepID=A0ABT5YJM7_9PROT|nr:EF-hand domain-containing protein [Fodinicurvata sp. CAU 1616]MDF2095099.1 EF-hand domain-containing protein [Fodinicurvata sp. CAU 1616]